MRNAGAVWRSVNPTVAAFIAVLTSVSCGTGGAQIGHPAENVIPASLSLNASSLNFGNVIVGNNATNAITLTNTSPTGGPSVTFSQVTVTGAGFTVTTASLPIVLAPSGVSTITVTFAPKAAGTINGSLSIAIAGASDPANVVLTGTGVSAGQLTASQSSLSFGSVVVGASLALQETLTNSGGSSITLIQVGVGTEYSVAGLNLPLTLNAGQSSSFSVSFAPKSVGYFNANVAITNNSTTPTFNISVSGTGVTPGALSVTSVNFGNVQVGSTSTQTATLTNTGGASVTVSQANLTGTGFSTNGMTLPLTLAAGQSFTFNVVFAPQTAGSASGSIALVSNASGVTPAISLSGTGTAAGQISVTPGNFSFGNVVVGSSMSLPAMLSAIGSSVTITSASVTGSEFALGKLSLPLTVSPGASVSFTLTFAPQVSGAASATLSFVSNASGSPTTASATGTATAAPEHVVTLSWTESTSNVVGYNIYRSETSGGPYAKLNTSADPSTTYADNSVQSGQTYYYVTTSVAVDGTESGYSNQANAVIPTP